MLTSPCPPAFCHATLQGPEGEHHPMPSFFAPLSTERFNLYVDWMGTLRMHGRFRRGQKPGRPRKQRQEDGVTFKASLYFRVGDGVSKPDNESIKEARDEGQGKAVWRTACLLCRSNGQKDGLVQGPGKKALDANTSALVQWLPFTLAAMSRGEAFPADTVVFCTASFINLGYRSRRPFSSQPSF